MEIEFMYHKDNTKPSFKEGDIIALKVNSDGIKTNLTNYYLLGKYNTTYYCLIDIKTGEMYMYQDYSSKRCLSKTELMDLIACYDGKVYKGDKAKLVIEDIKTNK